MEHKFDEMKREIQELKLAENREALTAGQRLEMQELIMSAMENLTISVDTSSRSPAPDSDYVTMAPADYISEGEGVIDIDNTDDDGSWGSTR